VDITPTTPSVMWRWFRGVVILRRDDYTMDRSATSALCERALAFRGETGRDSAQRHAEKG
jgi:hypothetical protein